jgi:formiminotetrahydrofolate cyclodeaminase
MSRHADILDQSCTIAGFLAATASRTPTPGGGSVTALAGALAAAIAEMALNFSIGKKSSPTQTAELQPIINELSRARRLLVELLAEDQSAYAELNRLHKLPADSPQRADSLALAVLMCIRAPQAIGATGLAVLELCGKVADRANPRLLSDLAIGAELAMAPSASRSARMSTPCWPAPLL